MSFEPLTPERRRAMTRQHLLDAAAIVFARDGFHGATLDAIASYAGFTKGAVYSNFKNKDDLFLALLDSRIERETGITIEVLDQSVNDAGGQMPAVRELLHTGTYLFDDNFMVLFLEFVLYARRNPEARARLVERARGERVIIEQMVEREYVRVGARGKQPIGPMTEVSRALFNGLALIRLIDPDAIDTATIDVALDVLMESMGVNDLPMSSDG
jgi:AcrR family transcriptional regulator